MMKRNGKRAEAGYSLVELLVGTGVMTIVLGATLAGLGDAIKANDAVLQTTGMNNSVRIAMDLVVRDLLQVGSGLPASHAIAIPSGSGSTRVKLPGPRDTTFTTGLADEDLVAVIPGPGKGPEINGVATDMITFMTSDNAFNDEDVDAYTSTSVTVGVNTPKGCTVGLDCTALNMSSGEDRILAGQLMLIEKKSYSTLVQVTGVNYGTRVISFGPDSLNLNQTCSACSGTLLALNLEDPAQPAVTAAVAADSMRITRIRMISYYLDTKVLNRPRLIRRINNGNADTFDNTLGTAVAMDIENLQFTYDLVDGDTNPSHLRFVAADYDAGHDPRTIRKVNVSMTGRSRNAALKATNSYRVTLTTQVSLRGMAFVDQYMAPEPPPE